MIDPIDIHVGTRVRQERHRAGMTQADLAAKIGLSFQQLQKYETGHNRISASKLSQIAEVLKQHPGVFFPQPNSAETTAPENPTEAKILTTYRALPTPIRDAFRRMMLAMHSAPTS